MIAIDYSQTVISNIMELLGNERSAKVELDLARHCIINAIRGYKAKFSHEFGQIVICCDAKNNWRKREFQYYKANRKKSRDDSDYDWASIYECMEMIRAELEENFPYPVLQVEGTEADDLIAVLAKWSQTNDLQETMFGGEPKPFLILSRDGDFVQLQKYSNVKQYSPIDKKWINPKKSAEVDLLEKIIRGDTGDGIPNYLSPDDVFVSETKKRQSSIFQGKLAVWLTQSPEEFCLTEDTKKNYERNKLLIDFDSIPADIEQAVLNTFTNLPVKGKSRILNYLMKHRMKHMLGLIDDF